MIWLYRYKKTFAFHISRYFKFKLHTFFLNSGKVINVPGLGVVLGLGIIFGGILPKMKQNWKHDSHTP